MATRLPFASTLNSGGDTVPGRLGLEQRLSGFDLAQIGGRSLERLIAESAWLIIHVFSLLSTFVTVHCEMRGES